MGISAVLFHTAWTGAYESFDTNPLIGAGLAHEFSDPQIRRSVVISEAELPVIRAFSGAYQWLNLAGFTINAELFESHFRFEGVGISCFWFSGSRFDSRSAEVPIQGLFKVTSTSDLSEAGLLSAFWAAHIGFVSIPASCSQDPRPHLGENVLAFISKPVATSFRAASGIVQSLETPIVLTYNAGIDGLTQAFTFSDLGHHHLAIGSFLLLAGEAQRFLELLGLLQHHALPSSYTSAGLSGGSRRKDLYLSHSLMILRILNHHHHHLWFGFLTFILVVSDLHFDLFLGHLLGRYFRDFRPLLDLENHLFLGLRISGNHDFSDLFLGRFS